MDNSIYIVLSRQTALFRDLEVSANNIANASTPGYNAQKLLFSQFLADDNRRKDAYANDVSDYRDTSSGSIRKTENPFDLAITGPGYFLVETPQGTRYTKAGNFQIDGDGTLMTAQGFPVLGSDASRITIAPDARSIDINGIGEIAINGEPSGQIGMVEFANEQELTRVGNTLFTTTQAATPSEQSRMVQGAVENSNVNAVAELIRVQELSRSVGSTAKFIETMYDLQRKVASTYTRASQA